MNKNFCRELFEKLVPLASLAAPYVLTISIALIFNHETTSLISPCVF